jgi:diaminopimelate epimerase
MIEFYKYQGAGNDFIMINNFNQQFTGDKVALAKEYCSRHFGIGSDGLIFLEKDEASDFIMDFYNPDGSQSFCGNGARCTVAFAKFCQIINGQQTRFKAVDGIHSATISGELVKVSMQNVSKIEQVGEALFIQTGSPHFVKRVKNVEAVDIINYGKEIRYDKRFAPGGTNVNIIHQIDTDKIAIRTYERGVENETLACGTGATAAALSFAHSQTINGGMVTVEAQGGTLCVYFTKAKDQFVDVFLEGPAKQVFKGEI